MVRKAPAAAYKIGAVRLAIVITVTVDTCSKVDGKDDNAKVRCK